MTQESMFIATNASFARTLLSVRRNGSGLERSSFRSGNTEAGSALYLGAWRVHPRSLCTLYRQLIGGLGHKSGPAGVSLGPDKHMSAPVLGTGCQDNLLELFV